MSTNSILRLAGFLREGGIKRAGGGSELRVASARVPIAPRGGIFMGVGGRRTTKAENRGMVGGGFQNFPVADTVVPADRAA